MSRAGSALLRALSKAPSRLYDARAGWLLGHRFLRVTHRGRVSGREYSTVLEVVGHLTATGEYVAVSGFGTASDWFRNIQASPPLRVEIGRTRFTPVHRVLAPEEAAAVFADYEQRHRALAPILRAVLSRLLGWRYDSSAHARARLTRQLPFVGFRPRPAHSPQQPTGATGSRWAGTHGSRLTLTTSAAAADAVLIELRGELDLDGATVVLAEIPGRLVRGSTTVLEASGVELADSSGLHALIVLTRIAQARSAHLRLADPSPPLQRLIAQRRADRIIDVRSCVDDALEN